MCFGIPLAYATRHGIKKALSMSNLSISESLESRLFWVFLVFLFLRIPLSCLSLFLFFPTFCMRRSSGIDFVFCPFLFLNRRN